MSDRLQVAIRKAKVTDGIPGFPRGSEITICRSEQGDFGLILKKPSEPEKGVGGLSASEIIGVAAWFLMPSAPAFTPKSEEEWKNYHKMLAKIGLCREKG